MCFDLACFGFHRRVGVAEKTDSYDFVCLRNVSGDGRWPEVDALDQVISPVKEHVVQNGLDERPHPVSGLKVILIGMNADCGRCEMQGHLKAVERKPRHAVNEIHSPGEQ